MTTADAIPPSVLRQRRRFEALGTALNKASSIKSWLMTLFAISLILGLPTIPMLVDPLKDGLTTSYQVILFGFRVLIISMVLFLASRITPEMYTAKNDFEIKLKEIGHRNPDTNLEEEKKLVYRSIIYKTLRIIILVASGIGIFLVGSRTNYGYIIGQQIIFMVIVVGLILTVKFWSSKGPDYSPRMGGRNLVLVFLPAVYLIGLESAIDFFSILSEPRFPYNTLQISWGIMYPFMFVILLLAILYTIRRTGREKISQYTTREAEKRRRESLLEHKGNFARFRYSVSTGFNRMFSVFYKQERVEKKDLDRRPNELLIKSIWLTLFITFIPFSLLIPWVMFPHDGILLLSALVIGYQYSMIRYDRNKVDVFSEPEIIEDFEPPAIRTTELSNLTFRLIMLPTIVFIIAQYLLGGTIGDEMVILGFTWISVLMIVPISIQLFYNIKTGTDFNRTLRNIGMYRNVLGVFLILELVLLLGSVVGRFFGSSLNVVFIPNTAIYLQAAFIGGLIIIPLIFQYVIPYLSDDTSYKYFKISTYIFIGLVDIAIIFWFIYDIIIGYFFTT
ncbi:MAG: hypothetical protein ACXABK_02860 [Candidatus Heimdallarchaeaceae archaeon]|jgi:hypothetical protein